MSSPSLLGCLSILLFLQTRLLSPGRPPTWFRSSSHRRRPHTESIKPLRIGALSFRSDLWISGGGVEGGAHCRLGRSKGWGIGSWEEGRRHMLGIAHSSEGGCRGRGRGTSALSVSRAAGGRKDAGDVHLQLNPFHQLLQFQHARLRHALRGRRSS